MPLEQVTARLVGKPWGVHDLRPWRDVSTDKGRIGEVWYERHGDDATKSLLLLKLLFTSQPLSIQVHPDDERAQAIGLRNGKTEAWYILAADPGAKVALGLRRSLSTAQLRRAVHNGAIAHEVVWQSVVANDVLHVPAGTIHAIGAGLVLAEVQQRCDTTFRLFDQGRARELHVEEAIAAARATSAEFQVGSSRISNERTQLLSNRHFSFERIELPLTSRWLLNVRQEGWLLVIGGSGAADAFQLVIGDALFAGDVSVELTSGPKGLQLLLAYPGRDGPQADLLARTA